MTYEQLSLFTDEELGIKTDYSIIGLTGYAQSGKDTVANILVSNYGYKRIAFADKIRDVLYDMNPIVKPGLRLKDAVDEYGWEKAKTRIPEVRTLLQNLGVAVRNHIHTDAWVEAALQDIDPLAKVVITDVRFINEAYHIRHQFGGQLWRIKRPGFEAVNSHVSEHEMDHYEVDQMFINSGTVEDLEASIKTRMHDAFTA